MNFCSLHNGNIVIDFMDDGTVILKVKLFKGEEGLKGVKEKYKLIRFSKSEWKFVKETEQKEGI